MMTESELSELIDRLEAAEKAGRDPECRDIRRLYLFVIGQLHTVGSLEVVRDGLREQIERLRGRLIPIMQNSAANAGNCPECDLAARRIEKALGADG
jgi:hypothetical protein